VAFFLQVTDQLNQCIHLGFGRMLAVEITHQADAYSVLVVSVNAGMCALDLFFPAERHFDNPIRRAMPVSDHEVIPDASPASDLLVVAVKRFFTAGRRAAVMDHNGCPIPLEWDIQAPSYAAGAAD
jgi:hypothetical protein